MFLHYKFNLLLHLSVVYSQTLLILQSLTLLAGFLIEAAS